MTFSEVYSEWKSEKSKTLKPTSYSTYVLMVDKHILPHIGHKGPITEEDVALIHDRVLESGASEKTAHDCAHILMGILRYASSKGWWPAPNWKISHEALNQRAEMRLMSKEEQRSILEYIRTDRTPRNIGIYIALTTGITIGELCNLRWQDIDIPARVLHVRGIVTRFYKMGEGPQQDERVWSVSSEDSGSARDIPLSPEQLVFLGEEEGHHLKEVFLMSNSLEAIDPRVVRTHLKGILKRLDIKGCCYKDLRHSFMVRCLESGCDFVSLAKLLGTNSYERMIAMYGKYCPGDPRQYMEKMM